MKSVTIKDARTGAKLIKVYHNKNGYFVESLGVVTDFDCLIVCNSKERITIPVRQKMNRKG